MMGWVFAFTPDGQRALVENAAVMAFDPTGTRVAVGSHNGWLMLHDAVTGRRLHQ